MHSRRAITLRMHAAHMHAQRVHISRFHTPRLHTPRIYSRGLHTHSFTHACTPHVSHHGTSLTRRDPLLTYQVLCWQFESCANEDWAGVIGAVHAILDVLMECASITGVERADSSAAQQLHGPPSLRLEEEMEELVVASCASEVCAAEAAPPSLRQDEQGGKVVLAGCATEVCVAEAAPPSVWQVEEGGQVVAAGCATEVLVAEAVAREAVEVGLRAYVKQTGGSCSPRKVGVLQRELAIWRCVEDSVFGDLTCGQGVGEQGSPTHTPASAVSSCLRAAIPPSPPTPTSTHRPLPHGPSPLRPPDVEIASPQPFSSPPRIAPSIPPEPFIYPLHPPVLPMHDTR